MQWLTPPRKPPTQTRRMHAHDFLAVPHLAIYFVIYLSLSQLSSAFSPLCSRATFLTTANSNDISRRGLSIAKLSAKGGSNGENVNTEGEKDDRDGMNEAFSSLESISSLDPDEDGEVAAPATSTEKGITFDGPPEDEAKLYSEMYKELEEEGEEGLYSNILGAMGGDVKVKKESSTILNDADGIGATSPESDETILKFKSVSDDGDIGDPDMDAFMAQALKEAVAEAREKTPDEVAEAVKSDSILDDEEMMKEMNKIFDKANKKLVESAKEIRKEQNALANKSAQKRQDVVEDSEFRLAEAQQGVTRLMGNVIKETAEVEKAIADLEAAKAEIESEPLTKVADLKGGGILKQGAFVGMVLFTLRSLVEIAQIPGLNGAAHGTPAAIQGAIAVACAVYFLSSKSEP